jgi:hypothetical protein
MPDTSSKAVPAHQDVAHRATYRLEVGVWKGTCKVCGWEVRHPVRRQAATIFRRHIVAARNGELRPPTIDLRDETADRERLATVSPGPPSH